MTKRWDMLTAIDCKDLGLVVFAGSHSNRITRFEIRHFGFFSITGHLHFLGYGIAVLLAFPIDGC